MKIQKLTANIGAEISGVDFARPVDPQTKARLKQAWLDNIVLIVREQPIGVLEHIEFARIFGPIDDDSPITAFSHPQHREIFVLSNETKDGEPSETRDVGWQWHTDLTYTTRPSAGAVLHAQAVPDFGGDTMFCNLCAAYDALSQTYKTMLAGLEAVHDLTNGNWYRRRAEKAPKEFVSRAKPVLQPMIVRHPETGRLSLRLGEAVVSRIHGMTDAESRPILGYLTEFAVQPEFVMRHRWRKGDLLIWDNRVTMHKVVADHNPVVAPGSAGQVRRMHRVTIKGLPSGRLLEPGDPPRAAA